MQKMTAVQCIKMVLFYLVLSLSSLVWSLVGLVCTPFLGNFERRWRFVIQNWCRFAVFWAKCCVGLRYEIEGLENLPKQPCVVLAQHQSTWETFFLTTLFCPLAHVVKRELFNVPVFGWAIASFRPIAIDRSNPREALKQVAKMGEKRLQQGCWVLIFPEGTRMPPGQMGKFTRSGAALAVNSGLAVLPIAHNAGKFWPKEGWAKYPGTIRVRIGQPMYAEGEGSRAIADLNQRAEAWVRQAQQGL